MQSLSLGDASSTACITVWHPRPQNPQPMNPRSHTPECTHTPTASLSSVGGD